MVLMNVRDKFVPYRPGPGDAAGVAANDADPFDGAGAGDWGETWMDQRLRNLFESDAHAQPSPRLAELLRRLEASMARDQRD